MHRCLERVAKLTHLSRERSVTDNDTLVFFDFRSDRMREIVETIGFPAKHFETDTVRQGLVHARTHACPPPQ